MKIFVIHYDKLVKRKEIILQQMNRFGLECEFISDHGKESLTNEERMMFRNITDGEISVALHHIECFKKVAEKYEYALILEDDVILMPNFLERLTIYIKQLPNDWDMLFIGDGCNLHIDKSKLIPNKYIYKKDNNIYGRAHEGATRCLDSYLITNICAKKIIEKMKQTNYTILVPADLWMNCVIKKNEFNIYWSEPTIVTQGSEKGLYKSALR
jgi:hypothetical protein